MYKIRKITNNTLNNKKNVNPLVTCQTNMHNTKVKLGRGFSLNCLQKFQISQKLAKIKGVRVDKRKKKKTYLDSENFNRLTSFLNKSAKIIKKREPTQTVKNHPLLNIIEIEDL